MVVGVLIFSVFFVCFIGIEERVFMAICVCVGRVRWVDVGGGHDARGSPGGAFVSEKFLCSHFSDHAFQISCGPEPIASDLASTATVKYLSDATADVIYV